ncbi:hypothetical protein LX32DRAFT_728554 [Colletotrichum zoysiae]|uniref:ABM domain-containing protein n=1 Tax=Colletotrichum zoysiae TaxID=1216348 RepID=A0AAD9HGS5_9PEZI|nr:hypothetical protein LX32DRAFT_728554 [Colletotrichum zoysiae]
MVFYVVVTPNIRADKKDEFLAGWAAIKGEIAKQPGVLAVAAGPVISEGEAPVTEFKYLEAVVYNSAADEKAVRESAWWKGHEAAFEALCAGPPRIAKFEMTPLAADKPLALTQFAFLDVADESKHDEAIKAWSDLAAALGQDAHFTGKGVDDWRNTGLGVLGWDSEAQFGSAYAKPEARAALDKYKSFGKGMSVLVKLEA